MKSNKSLELKTKVIIEEINVIDTKDMMMEVTVRMMIRWVDSRLKLKNVQPRSKILIPSKTIDELWLPFDNIVHDNAMIGKIQSNKEDRQVSFSSMTPPLPVDIEDAFENRIFNSHENVLEMQQRYRIAYICTFSLQKFPFDEQNCNLSMSMRLEKNSTMIFTKNNNGASYRGPKIVTEFKIGLVTTHVGIDWNRIWFKYNIKMTRLYMNQIINTIFPTCLLWVLAYSTLFINVQNFNNRFMGSVTFLLVLAALLGSINNSLPKTSYFKYIDLWFLWYITNIFLIIISHIILDGLNDEDNGKMVLWAMRSKSAVHSEDSNV